MATQVLEGTGEEIAARADELAGKRVMLIVQPDEIPTAGPPNEKMLAILREIEERQEGRRETKGDSVADVRHGRLGPMYGMPFVNDMWMQPDDD